MSVKSKDGRKPKDGNVCAAILDAVETLWNKHAPEIHRIRQESEDKSIVVNFSNDIDCSESKPMVTTRIRYSESFTDKITNRLDDPNQGTFTEITAAAAEQKRAQAKADKKASAAES